MSLYTFSKTDQLPTNKIITGLRMEKCSNVKLLSEMGSTTEDDVTNRLLNRHVAFVAYVNNQPAAFGWMATQKAKIGELNHEIVLPEGNRYLWNFRTLEAFRGLGIYPALLQYIIQSEIERAERFWIIHAPENKSSLSGIIKAGFQFVGTLFTNEEGIAAIETTALSDDCRSILNYMNIKISESLPASCWNCSSPYLKKRTMKCCCEKAEKECVGKSLLAMASS
ncbi:MAG TPA: N-acetyltransferase [Hanamia sp.]|nr:N-acetyltransferase [Hanamia sp.]